MVDFNDRRDWTARRETKGEKTFVRVKGPGGHDTVHGGKRAERASSVIVVKWPKAVDATDAPGVYGLRGDSLKASAEAQRLANPTNSRHTKAEWSHAIPVEDE